MSFSNYNDRRRRRVRVCHKCGARVRYLFNVEAQRMEVVELWSAGTALELFNPAEHTIHQCNGSTQ